ncbi:hypothetical protein SNA_21355 [Streptomyces natalensis ATCC 27448]|uniref:Uncharacterized protein n=1 Tax=Streptomyces natalensis ATCC 27448 TaxID=1240678 RepID=A0A0D7CK92_9ACTN|nr:hypothetical protein SNA_21355 [Streptomyces natalensis ATCC 27448]
MSAVGDVQGEHGVPPAEARHVGGRVGLGAGVRLEGGVLGAEEDLGAFDCDALDDVRVRASGAAFRREDDALTQPRGPAAVRECCIPSGLLSPAHSAMLQQFLRGRSDSSANTIALYG